MEHKKRVFSSKKARVVLLIVGAILVIVGQTLFAEGWQERQNALSSNRGEISPSSAIDPTKPLFVELGGLGNNFNVTELANGIDLTRLFHLQQGNKTFNNFPVQISFVGNKLSISAEIKNSDNATIARIVDNNWATVNPDTLLIWDRNYNSYAFEVIDSNKIPVLQVLLAGQNRILIGCNLWQQGIAAFFTLTKGFSFYSDGNVTQEKIQDLRSSTIFKYPSNKHLGETVDNLQSLVDLSYSYGNPSPSNNPYPISNPLADSTWLIVSSIVLSVFGTVCIGSFGAETYIILKEKKQRQKSGNKTNKSRNNSKIKPSKSN